MYNYNVQLLTHSQYWCVRDSCTCYKGRNLWANSVVVNTLPLLHYEPIVLLVNIVSEWFPISDVYLKKKMYVQYR